MRTLFTAIIIFISHLSFADAWDNLTLREAEAVVLELELNPFIFDYCDCCDSEGEYASTIQFLKVIDANIVQCSWDENYYSVKIETILLCNVFYAPEGADINRLIKPTLQENAEYIYMNYTWTLDPERKMAIPYFDRIEYSLYESDAKPCKTSFPFPTPKQLKKVSKDKSYKKWYNEVM